MLVILAQLLTTSKRLQPQTRSHKYSRDVQFVWHPHVLYLCEYVNIFVVLAKSYYDIV